MLFGPFQGTARALLPFPSLPPSLPPSHEKRGTRGVLPQSFTLPSLPLTVAVLARKATRSLSASDSACSFMRVSRGTEGKSSKSKRPRHMRPLSWCGMESDGGREGGRKGRRKGGRGQKNVHEGRSCDHSHIFHLSSCPPSFLPPHRPQIGTRWCLPCCQYSSVQMYAHSLPPSFPPSSPSTPRDRFRPLPPSLPPSLPLPHLPPGRDTPPRVHRERGTNPDLCDRRWGPGPEGGRDAGREGGREGGRE